MSDDSTSMFLVRGLARGATLLRGDRLAAVSRRSAHVAAVLAAALVVWNVASIARVISARGYVVPQSRAPAPLERSTSAVPDYQSLPEAHLFGEALRVPTTQTPETAPAPDTDLPLTLTGVLVVDGDGPSAAIVATSNSQRTYQIGDVIDGVGATNLRAVYADRVLLARDGVLETLRLRRDTPPEMTVAASGAVAATAVEAEPPGLSEDELAAANAARAAAVVQVTPDYADDRFVGFRVGPGNDRKHFESSGLRTGDVITSVNGEPVADPGGATQLL